MALKQRLTTTLVVSIAVFASCSGDNQIATNAPTQTVSPAVAANCTREAQVSIFRPADFSSLVNRSVLVVLGHVTDQSTAVEIFDTPASTPLPDPPPSTRVDEVNVQLPPTTKALDPATSFRVTWVDSTISVERTLFSAKPSESPSSIVVRTMAEGPTCDRRDALPLKDQRYVLFLNTADVDDRGTQRYYTIGGSWAGRLIVEGDMLRPDTPAGISASPASTAVAARQLSSLAADIAGARQPK